MNTGKSVAWLRWTSLASVAILTACATPSSPTGNTRLTGPRDNDLQRILATPRPPLVVALTSQPWRISPRAAARLTSEVLSEQRGARQIQIAAVPLLRSTPEGSAFLAAPGHRALAQGEPAASCPALAPAPPGAPNPVAAARASLTQCTAQLTARSAPSTCGCRLIALDNALLAPIQRFAFAPAVSALMISGGKATRMIAEADISDGIAITRLRDAGREIGVLLSSPAGDSISAVINDIPYTGTREPFGFRRGRLAERITLSDATGNRLSLLIGVERRDATPK